VNVKFFIELVPKLSLIKTAYYSLKFRGFIFVGKGARINIKKRGRVVFDNNKSSLYIGVHFSTANGATLDIYEGGRLNISKSVGIHRGTKVVVRENAELKIGASSFINENSRILCRKKISIGHNTSIGWSTTLTDTDSHGIYIDGKVTNPDAELTIGNKVWVCANTTITKGTTIEDNCIVGSNSLVIGKLLKSNTIYAGNPLRIIRNFDTWGHL